MAKSSFVERNKAVREAWNKELELVQEGKGTREWTPEQQKDILERGRAYDEKGNCFTWIKVSCLHFGQNSGKFLSSVSFRIFNLVLFPQTGHNIQFSLSIFYYSPFILLLTIRGSELLQLLRLRTFHSRLYLQDNHWHTVLLFPL